MLEDPNFKELQTLELGEVYNSENEVTCKIDDLEDEVASILSCTAHANVGEIEVTASGVNFQGFVNFQVIYNGNSGGTYSLDYTVDYKDTFDKLTSGNVYIMCNVADTKCEIVGNSLMLTATLKHTFSPIANDSIQALVSVPDNYSTKSEDVTLYTFVGEVVDKYDATIDIDLKGEVNKVLSVTPTIVIEKYTLSNGLIRVEGNMNVTVWYMLDGTLSSYTNTSDLDYEIAYEGVSEDCFVFGNAYVDTPSMRVETNVSDGKTHIAIVFPIVFRGVVTSRSTVEIISDLYSTTNVVTPTYSTNVSHMPVENVTFEERVDGSITVTEDMPFVDDILGVANNNCYITAYNVDGEYVTVEGINTVTVLYLTKEDNSTHSLSLDIPFSTPIRINDEATQIKNVECTLVDLSAKSKRGKEIEVFGKMNISFTTFNSNTFVYISDLEVGEELKCPKYALSVYFVSNGQTMWDIAKQVGMTENELLEINPDVTLPLTMGDRIFVYRPR